MKRRLLLLDVEALLDEHELDAFAAAAASGRSADAPPLVASHF